MAITFPASPTNGQIFTSGNKSWIWNGVTWLAYGASLSPTVLKVDVTNSRVGINNQSPAAALDVAGNIALTGSVVFEGATADAFETTLSVTNPTADNTLTLPDISGTIAHTNNWISYTPSWTTSGTPPNLGNGTLSGAYCQIGKVIFVQISFLPNTTTTFGTSTMMFSVPITMQSPTQAYQALSGGGYAQDSSAAAENILAINYNNVDTSRVMLRFNQPAGAGFGEVTSTAPFTWASTDRLTFSFTYGIA